MGVPYHIVVEEQEFDEYAAVIDPRKILVLDLSYKEKFDCLDDLGLTVSTGSGPARNFIWDHSIEKGHKWHWIMDDNIKGFYRLNRNLKVPVGNGSCFRAMEDFCLRYVNVAMAGPNYFMFSSRKSSQPPFVANTRIYSCNLIRNDLPYRWRGRFNEDTDLSLRMLKDGWCTILFNACLQYKTTSMQLKGGNTEMYEGDGRWRMAEMLRRTHPDVTRVTRKWNRWQHTVDYKPFKKNKLVKKKNLRVKPGVDNYGMKLRKVEK
tara:strand:+ start:721 stop:1509 length:789 start_codon:yes stop_codon:yes gene_type:complete